MGGTPGTSGLQGMDVEYADAAARQMDGGAEMVGGMVAAIGTLLDSVMWVGADSTSFHSDWSGTFVPQMQGAVNALKDNATVLRRRAEAQRQASAQ